MISILDKINHKPSVAIKFALDGIKTQTQRPDFRLNMGTFGDYAPITKTCYGCAATCAIQEIAGKNLDQNTIFNLGKRSDALGFDYKELEGFEGAIDCARNGVLLPLGLFCGVDLSQTESLLSSMEIVSDAPEGVSIGTLEKAFTLLVAAGF